MRGEHMSTAEFREPILPLLHGSGGQLDRQPALRRLEEMIGDQLTEADRSDIESGTIRWEKAAEWQVYNMRRDGLLEPVITSGPGVWKLTGKGVGLAARLAGRRS